MGILKIKGLTILKIENKNRKIDGTKEHKEHGNE